MYSCFSKALSQHHSWGQMQNSVVNCQHFTDIIISTVPFLQPFIVIRSFYFLVAFLPFFLTLPVPSLFHRAGSPAHSQLVRMSAAAQRRCWCSGKTGWTPQPTCGVSWSLWATTRHMVQCCARDCPKLPTPVAQELQSTPQGSKGMC